MSNSRDVLSVIPEEEQARPNLDLDLANLPVERTLGVQWDVEKDVFLFTVREPNQPPTKRGILSAVSSLYDPMGFVCPVVMEAKKILQKLWKLKQGWDDEIPDDLQYHWNKWKSELPQVQRMNPADDASCGLKRQKLSNQHRWWRGPEFLWEPEDR